MVSQKDIARKLNMTQQAVSAALRSDGKNGTVKVAPETRQLVLETARKLGYRSNRYASILKGGRSHMIAIFHGPMTNDWIKRLRALTNAVREAGFIPWTVEVSHDDEVPKHVDYVLSAKIEGVIVAGAWFPWNPAWFWDHDIPVVALHGSRHEGVPFYAPDKISGFEEILTHLFEQGCRRPIVCLALTKEMLYERGVMPTDFIGCEYEKARSFIAGAATQAMMGLERFRRKSGFSLPEPFCVFLSKDSVPERYNEFATGGALAREALPYNPDALVFTNDSMAIGGLYACREAGLDVPQDLCVSGFNGESMTRYSLVPISTVIQPDVEMAKAALARLFEMIETKTLKGDEECRFPCRFEPRLSTMFRQSAWVGSCDDAALTQRKLKEI